MSCFVEPRFQVDHNDSTTMHVSGCSFLLVYRAFKFLDQLTKIQNHNSDTYIYLHSIVRESPSKVGR
jgi:hypothetical protein